jgi:hypothetical protein
VTPSGHIRKQLRLAAILPLSAAFLCSARAEEPAGHWSLKPLKITQGATLDSFIDEALEKKGLQQNDAADRYTLIRRATIDLTGLPPTREEIEAFASDESPDAREKLVERVIGSPH